MNQKYSSFNQPEHNEPAESRRYMKKVNLETNTTQFEVQTKSDQGIKRGQGLFAQVVHREGWLHQIG